MAKCKIDFSKFTNVVRDHCFFYFLCFFMEVIIPCSKGFAQDTTKINAPDSIPAGMDFVRLINDDRLLGKLLKISRGNLYFDGDKTGDVKIKLRNIKSLRGQKKLYRIDVINKGMFTGKIGMLPNDGYFSIIQSSGNYEFPITAIISLVSFEKNFLERIDGNLHFGYSFTKSSHITRFNLSNEVIYTSEKWQVKQAFSGIYTVGDGDGLERIDASIEGLLDLKKRWKIISELQYQRMLELGLKARMIGIAGIGKRIVQTRHMEMDAGTGFSLQREYAVIGGNGKTGAEIPVLFNFHLFDLEKPDIDISSNAIFYTNLSVSGRRRFDYKLNFSYEVVQDFLIGLQFFYNYDSNPLFSGSGTADFGNVFTLGYKF